MSSTRPPGDHFTTVSSAYAAFRPRYPKAVFEFVASIAPRRKRAWDCGAGNGQATTDLAEYFDEVIATDLSAAQIAKAPQHPKIRWVVAPAESAPIESGSIDLVTVAQALHWFDHARFYDEVRRVSAPGAAIAAWTYGVPQMEGAIGAALHRLMFETLGGGYWPPERKYVEDEYRSIPFPFERLAAPAISLRESWTFDQVAGYARSWSATGRYAVATGKDAVESFEREARPDWPNDSRREIVWPLVILAGRVR